jgi:hypothetical protein
MQLETSTLLRDEQAKDILRGKTLVFLVGAPRSGTTWLQLLLARSPAIATAQETHLYDLFFRSMLEQWEHLERTNQKVGLNKLLTREEFRDLLRYVSASVFAKIAANKPAATVILEKTPNHVYCWREILETWPKAHFIHLIRDPRSVAASMRVASRTWASQWASSRVSRNCQRWISDVSNGRQIPSQTPNYQEVTYDELLSNGPATLMRLLAGIGLSVDWDECQRYVDECKIDKLKAGKLSDAPFDVAKMHPESFRVGTTDSWRSELSPWEIALVEHMAGPLMRELGFELVSHNRITSVLLHLRDMAKNAKNTAKGRLETWRNRSTPDQS